MDKCARYFGFSVVACIVTLMSGCFRESENTEPSVNPTFPPQYFGDAAKSDKSRNANPQISAADLSSQIKNNTDFSIALMGQFSQSAALQNKNIVFSPFGISQTAAMLSAGAANNTLTQINQGLHFLSDQSVLHNAFNSLGLSYASRAGTFSRPDNSTGAIELVISNALWSQKDYSFQPTFLDTLAVNYGAGVNLVDFRADPNAARATINDWVAKQTKNKIVDAMPAGSITVDTRLALTNTVYFKGNWLLPFSSGATHNQLFTRLDGSTVDTPFMAAIYSLGYVKTADVTAVELKLIGEKLSMLLIMPDAGNFSTYAASIDSAKIESVVAGLQSTHISLTLPKFDFKTDVPLGATLKALGVVDAFDGNADFSRIDGTTNLFVQSAIHKAFVTVDEVGMEAGAFTGISVGVTSLPPTVVIDHPFLFLVRDLETNSILFFGRVLDPMEK